jgi:hypothetical protein
MRTGTPSLPRRYSKRIAGWLEPGSVGRISPQLRAALITPDHPSRSYASAIRTTYLPNASSWTCTAVDRGGVANGQDGVGRLRFLGEGVALAVLGGVFGRAVKTRMVCCGTTSMPSLGEVTK